MGYGTDSRYVQLAETLLNRCPNAAKWPIFRKSHLKVAPRVAPRTDGLARVDTLNPRQTHSIAKFNVEGI